MVLQRLGLVWGLGCRVFGLSEAWTAGVWGLRFRVSGISVFQTWAARLGLGL